MSSLPIWLYSSSTPVAKTWTDLPSELLTKIANNLGIKDLLCFRAICKDWRSASFPCSAENESCGKPWLLVSQGSNSCYILYNPLEKTTYNINIPEMEGTLCLGTSDGGWLLLSRQNQLFFFCPFTRAKVELPEFPHLDLADRLAAFTHSPTSQECVVIVAYSCNESELELHVIKRGENKWNRIVYKHKNNFSTPLTLAACSQTKETIIYSNIIVSPDHNSDTRWVVYFSPKNSSFGSSHINVASKGKGLYLCGNSRNYMDQQVLEVLKIKENADIIPTCGPIAEENKNYLYHWNKSIKKTCEESQKVIFIHPRFHQIPASQGWSV